MSDRVQIYCEDCGSTAIEVRPQSPPRRVSIDEYIREQTTQPATMDLVKRYETWIVHCTNCGKTRMFQR